MTTAMNKQSESEVLRSIYGTQALQRDAAAGISRCRECDANGRQMTIAERDEVYRAEIARLRGILADIRKEKTQ